MRIFFVCCGAIDIPIFVCCSSLFPQHLFVWSGEKYGRCSCYFGVDAGIFVASQRNCQPTRQKGLDILSFYFWLAVGDQIFGLSRNNNRSFTVPPVCFSDYLCRIGLSLFGRPGKKDSGAKNNHLAEHCPSVIRDFFVELCLYGKNPLGHV